ncbi:MAG: hypothetical protein A3B82_00190 [Methylophilales bacterium RIFCSPHIGHO2_02_FULL_57_10]|nr:MAG: hypothetical protein A3B82_00190 [Methylophilales bacterium RIFCSPHIGHO2_02_FULL_57_10]
MRSRWLLNLALLVLVAGVSLFLYLRPKPVDHTPQTFALSTLDPQKFSRLSIEAPAKTPVLLEKQQGRWRLVQPAQGRADPSAVGQVLSVAVATTREKFPAVDLARFGLDSPSLKVHVDDQEFSFGMYNPVSGDQFVAYKDSVYTLPTIYAEGATIQPLEFLDKHLLDVDEEIAGFDFSALEQWEKSRLNLDRQKDGKWKVSAATAKPNQDEINQWFSDNWQRVEAQSVEPFKPDREQHPYFLVKLKNGKTIRFIKMQESPELLLVREDEQLQYHILQDTGFGLLNPPVGYKE